MRVMQSMLAVVALTALLCTVGVRESQAVSFSFNSSTSGFSSFINDNDVQLARFTITEPFELVTITTNSYAAGGFDPTFALFTDTGDPTTDLFLGQSDNVDFDNGLYDDVLSTVVPAGTYLIALTQYDNLAVGPDNRAQGFLYDGAGNENFTDPSFAGPGGAFTDFDGNVRNGTWSISGSSVAIPEAPSLLLLLPGAILVTGMIVRRRMNVKGSLIHG